jgi:hypothetical protein
VSETSEPHEHRMQISYPCPIIIAWDVQEVSVNGEWQVAITFRAPTGPFVTFWDASLAQALGQRIIDSGKIAKTKLSLPTDFILPPGYENGQAG